ncbi:uncharacterized protein LOC112511760 [Cynara cardunculus var. scolymus]|nr:uncharacterized protein LOC112511760 [Cynara cardunculus var. scolymus]XP_024973276.1 uncharacterized protein LOC112511760 [Cynara cardunculus var. scolymus]
MIQRFSSGLLKISILRIRHAQMKYLEVCFCKLHLYKIMIRDIFFLYLLPASNGEVRMFSSSLELATKETITNATEWMNTNIVADGGTNLLLPLKQAIEMVGKTSGASSSS